MVGFLWIDDEGQLKPKLVVPADGKGVPLSEKLTAMVTKEGRAVWIDNQSAHRMRSAAPHQTPESGLAGIDSQPSRDTAETLSHFADAICVPLVYGRHTLGAI